jgi:hypothetical protein
MGRRLDNMDGILKKEFDYYIAHQEEMVEKYNGKVIVLSNQKVIGVYDDDLSALMETQKTQTHKPGTFLIQRVTPGKSGYTQTFHSRVGFS